jgi:hypothetical protein
LRRLLLEAASDSDPPEGEFHTPDEFSFTESQNRRHRTSSTVVVSELRTDFDGTPWEDVYHEVRTQLTSTSVLVVDKWAYPDAAVDVLITVRSAGIVMQPNTPARDAILRVYAEHRSSGARILVGICAVGGSAQEAKEIVIGWLPGDIEGSFYVVGVPDIAHLYEIMTKWLLSAIRRKSPQMRDGSRISRVLDLAPDPYNIPGDELL